MTLNVWQQSLNGNVRNDQNILGLFIELCLAAKSIGKPCIIYKDRFYA